VIPADAELTPRNDAFPAWESVPEAQRPLLARQMEVFAGFLENAGWNVGRVLDAIGAMGELDNTLVIYIPGDNGASMEGSASGTFNELTMQNGIVLSGEQQVALIDQYGGLETWGTEIMSPHYAAAWAWAGNCPFQWGKQVASHLGGTRQPMVVSWPRAIADKGGLRSQFTHVIDIGPMILEAAGIPVPTSIDGIEQTPLHGTSFLYSFADADAPERHTQQYFEIFGNRAMYKDGWLASWMLPRIPWDATPDTMKQFAPGVRDPDSDPAELYYLPDDFSQARNLAADHPEKVAELRALFWEEAEKYLVLPLLGGLTFYFGIVPPLGARTTFAYHGSVQNVASGMIPRIYNHSYSISADLEIPPTAPKG
jgi:arylsulfatase A-like enzyme